MTGKAGASLADWLAAHDLTPAMCRAVLADPPQRAPHSDDPVWPVAAETLWHQVADMLAAGLPAGAGVIRQTLATARTEFSGQGRWGARAFTLHDDGSGNPLVVMGPKGKMSDLLTLAHEFGHAVQIVAGKSTPTPAPVDREVCACLAEAVVLQQMRLTDPAQAEVAARLLAARVARKGPAARQALLAALDHPTTPYDYDWNYPMARALAGAAMSGLTAADQWQLYTGQIGTADLARLFQR